MAEIIDLSQEIYEGMPVYKDLPQVKMSIHNTHEEWEGLKNPKTKTPQQQQQHRYFFFTFLFVYLPFWIQW